MTQNNDSAQKSRTLLFQCKYICHSVCTYDESDYAGEDCPFDSVTKCPVWEIKRPEHDK